MLWVFTISVEVEHWFEEDMALVTLGDGIRDGSTFETNYMLSPYII